MDWHKFMDIAVPTLLLAMLSGIFTLYDTVDDTAREVQYINRELMKVNKYIAENKNAQKNWDELFLKREEFYLKMEEMYKAKIESCAEQNNREER